MYNNMQTYPGRPGGEEEHSNTTGLFVARAFGSDGRITANSCATI